MFCKSKGVSTCTTLILTGQAAAINFGWVRFMSYFLHDIVVLHEHGICGQYIIDRQNMLSSNQNILLKIQF